MNSPHNQQYLELAELAGGFIHEIKNHINTLSLNLQLLAEDFETPETPRERLAARGIVTGPPVKQPWLWLESWRADPAGNKLCLYEAGINRRYPPWAIPR